MKKIFLLLILVCFSASSQLIKLENSSYTVIFDKQAFCPLYAFYEINFDNYDYHFKRSAITLDKRLHRSEQGNSFDYSKNKNFDRGHLVPVVDFDFDKNLLKEINIYTNIAPQDTRLNRGVWRDLENYIHNKYLFDKKKIKVWTGIIPGYRLLGKLKVPLFFWKMIEIDGVFYAWKFPNTQLLNQNFSFYETDPLALQQLIQNYGFENFY